LFTRKKNPFVTVRTAQIDRQHTFSKAQTNYVKQNIIPSTRVNQSDFEKMHILGVKKKNNKIKQ
jgi:hypothetical protein